VPREDHQNTNRVTVLPPVVVVGHRNWFSCTTPASSKHKCHQQAAMTRHGTGETRPLPCPEQNRSARSDPVTRIILHCTAIVITAGSVTSPVTISQTATTFTRFESHPPPPITAVMKSENLQFSKQVAETKSDMDDRVSPPPPKYKVNLKRSLHLQLLPHCCSTSGLVFLVLSEKIPPHSISGCRLANFK
jgi:hypothetical protein